MIAYICVTTAKSIFQDDSNWTIIRDLLVFGLEKYDDRFVDAYLPDTYLKIPNISFCGLYKRTVSPHLLTIMSSLLQKGYSGTSEIIIDRVEDGYKYPYLMELNLRIVKMLFYEAFFKLGVNPLYDATLVIDMAPQPYSPIHSEGVVNLINKYINSTEQRIAYLLLTHDRQSFNNF